MIWVLAGDYRQFGQFCHDELQVGYRLAERRGMARYIMNPYSFRGYFGRLHIVKYGTWYRRPDLREIEAQIRCMQRLFLIH